MITISLSVLQRPVAYSLASGLAATTTGTAASLLAAVTARIAVRAALTVVISVASGLAYDAVTGRIRALGRGPGHGWPRHGPGPPQHIGHAGDGPDGR
jgi:hypothetical protein